MTKLSPCFVLSSEQHPAEALLTDLLTSGLDQCLVRLGELPGAGDAPLYIVALRELRSGAPLDPPAELGVALSVEDRRALLIASEDPSRATLRLFIDGESAFGWSGEIAGFLAELPPAVSRDGGDLRGPEGFDQAARLLAGAEWGPLREAASATIGDAEAGDVAEVDTALLLRGRALGLPIGLPRRPDFYRFHVQEAHERQPGDRLTMVLLDPRVYGQLWLESSAADAADFLEGIAPVAPAVLGPLASALPAVLETIEGLEDPQRPLAEASGAAKGELLEAFEALAMGTALGYLSGETVSYFDERFFPLLALADSTPTADVLAASLEEIEGLGVLSAMAEVLPYSVPEGALLESFADDEVAPLAEWALEGGEYEGSLFPVDLTRIVEQVAGFDGEAFAARVGHFLELWAELAPEQVEGEQRQAIHQRSLDDFSQRLEELRMLLSLAQVNELQPALLFFAG